jgi:hypothetical protein
MACRFYRLEISDRAVEGLIVKFILGSKLTETQAASTTTSRPRWRPYWKKRGSDIGKLGRVLI